MDDKLTKIAALNKQIAILTDEKLKLTDEVQAELDLALSNGKVRKKRETKQKELPLSIVK